MIKSITSRFWRLGVLFIALNFNCSDNSNPSGVLPPTEIIPLAVGNTWTHIGTVYADTIGNVSYIDTVTIQFTGDTIINKHTWFCEKRMGPYHTNMADGYYVYDREAMDTIKLYYPYPCKVGDKSFMWEVVNTDTQITVPKGKYSCILYEDKFESENHQYLLQMFVAPGRGWVKSVSYSGFLPPRLLHKQYEYQLLDYQLAGVWK